MVAGPAVYWHLATCKRPSKVVALHEVRLVVEERSEHRLQVRWRHLTVGGQDDHHICAAVERALATRCDGSAHTEVAPVRNQLEAACARQSSLRRPIGASVIDDDHVVDEGWDTREGGANEPCLVVSRDHGGDRSAFEHAQAVAIVSVSHGQPLARDTAAAYPDPRCRKFSSCPNRLRRHGTTAARTSFVTSPDTSSGTRPCWSGATQRPVRRSRRD